MANANMKFKADLLPNTDLGYNLGDSSHRWNIYGNVIGDVTGVAYQKYYWHDILGFCRIATPSYEITTDGTNWTTDTLDSAIFDQQNITSIQLFGNNIVGHRWTWNSNSFNYSSASYLVTQWAYNNPEATRKVTVYRSSDGNTWTNIGSASYSSGSTNYVIGLSSHGSNPYFRVEILRTSDTGTSRLTNLRYLSNRPGDQGQGVEYEFPYQWTKNGDIYPIANNTKLLGTSSYYWKDAYITTVHGDVTGSSTSVKDYNNNTLTKFGYSTSGMTSASWLGSWDATVSGEYRLRAITPANALKSGIGATAIGSATKPTYWTGSAFAAITSYEGNAATATKAGYIEGTNDAANPGGALLRSGSGRADASPAGDTWIYWDTLGGTINYWGIKHNQAANTIGFYGSGTERVVISMGESKVTATTFAGKATSAGTADTATKFTSSQSITLTGDTTGTASSQAGWSIPTTTNQLSYKSQITTLTDLDAFGKSGLNMKIAKVSALDGHTGTLTKNDGIILAFPWSGGYGHQFYVDDNGYGLHHRYWYTHKVNDVDTVDFNNWVQIIDSNNYTNYTVTKTGNGASGNWGISITGNAATATALSSNAGGTEQPVYFTGGKPAATSYALKATVNNGTASQLAYYSGDRAISGSGGLRYYTGNSTASTPAAFTRLHIYGSTYGNTAANLISGTAGLFSFGDGGPQITFDTSATPGGSQAGALIFTDHDSAATGASWHFVSNQGDWNVTSKRFHARTGISIGTNLPNTSYNLYVNGSSYFSNTITGDSLSAWHLLAGRPANTTNFNTYFETISNLHHDNPARTDSEMSYNRFFLSNSDQSSYGPTALNLPVVDQHVLSFGIDNGATYSRHIALDIRTNDIYTRARINSTWGNWEQLVRNTGTWGINITGSAASLNTSRSIWGQTFNGTANVSGNMTDMGPNVKLPSGQTTWSFLTSSGGAGNANFGKLGLNGTYANIDLTNYTLDVNGKTRINNELRVVNDGIWVQGGSNAGGNNSRMTLTSGMPTGLQYNSSQRGVRIFSNAIAFADPYNGNSNNDSGWIRHIEETANTGLLEIATGDDGSNEQIVARQYNTSSAVAAEIKLLDGSHNSVMRTIVPTATNTYTLGSSSLLWSRIYTNGVGADDSMTVHPSNSNELNFGGTNNSSTIFFGYRAWDSKPIPTKFIFGGSTGSADLQAKTVYLGSGTSSYISSSQYTGKAATAGTADKISNITTADAASSSDVWRNVWISYSDNATGRPAYDTDLAYQTSTDTLKSSKYQLKNKARMEYNDTTNAIDFIFL